LATAITVLSNDVPPLVERDTEMPLLAKLPPGPTSIASDA
jgi:hypothetical protein